MAAQRKDNLDNVRAQRRKLAGFEANSDVVNIGQPAGTGLVGITEQILNLARP